jgi:hypothetical protein
VKHRRKKTLGLYAIFKEVSAATRADRLTKVSQSLGAERHNENKASMKIYGTKFGVISMGFSARKKQFEQEEDKYL